MADIQGMLKDPDFKALPPEEMRKVMVKVDQDFAGLPGGEQDKVLSKLSGRPSLNLPADKFKSYSPELRSSMIDFGVSMLPAVGATVAPMLGPAGIIPAAMLAVGGGAGGRLVQNLIRPDAPDAPKTPMERFTDPLVEGGKMGLLEMLGGAVGSAFRRSASAAKFAADPAAQNLQKFSEANNLPFSPSTIFPSKTASAIESAVNLFPTGKAVTTAYQNRLSDWLLKSRGQVISDLTGIGTGGTGKRLIEATGDVKTGLAKGVKQAYEDIVPNAATNVSMIPMTETQATLKALLEDGTAKGNKNLKSLIAQFEKKLQSTDPLLKPTSMDAKDFVEWQAQINRKAKGQDNYGLADKIWEAVNNDLKAFDTKEGSALLDAVSGAKLDAKTKFNYDFLSGLFQKSTTTGGAGQEIFKTGQFYDLVMNDANKKKLTQAFGSDVYANLKDYAETALKISKETGKRAMSPIGTVFQTGMAGGGVAAAAMNPTLLVPYGAAPLVAWRIMEPRGVFKKWLTVGLNPEKTGTVLKIGGRAAISGSND